MKRKLALPVSWTTFKCMTFFINLEHANKFSLAYSDHDLVNTDTI